MASQPLRDKDGTPLIIIEEHVLHGPYNPGPHTHHNLEISCVLQGNGRYEIAAHEYDLQPGDIVILNNTEPHGLFVPEGVILRHLVIHFDPSFIWNSLSNAMDYNFLLVFFERGERFSNVLDRGNPATPHIFTLLQEMRQEFEERRVCYELMIKIKLQTVFAEIIRNYDYVDLKKASKPLPEEDISQLNAVLSYIDEHLDADIRLADLAAIVHVSPAYFSTLFKRFNGVSPVEYIVHKRVQRAIELIRTTSQNLTEIAMACGFNNGTNFYKAFRRVTGRTPASYRGNTTEDTASDEFPFLLPKKTSEK
ncbi:MAG TPA: AraC family transcriptional regulator [Firmicutes bacterium]|nr:AraC family transcriptional regulator [Bacillota bacterium]